MPVLPSTAYNTVEAVLLRARAMLNDMEIQGGDVLTDTAPFTMQFVSIAYEMIQRRMATVGVETNIDYFWLLNLPTVPTQDPEARLIISDSGTSVTFPSGAGGFSQAQPSLPTNLVVPKKLWERQNGTVNYPSPMKERIGGLNTMVQQTFLVDWEWVADTLQFRGALQGQDVKIKFEKALQPVVTVNDPVPIRGVTNAAAFYLVEAFLASRGEPMVAQMDAIAIDELKQLKNSSVRRRQRIKHRRRPYRGFGGRQYPVL